MELQKRVVELHTACADFVDLVKVNNRAIVSKIEAAMAAVIILAGYNALLTMYLLWRAYGPLIRG
jgi:folate-dependent phosphoribosylglycinamide formyltransferase PurN